ncbi:hypothetical protein D0B54_00595 [Solimonas sp. K1W22B-7]|nr:hypothetical protein D0B54_00595 [Solimonas sp. K1W22B-7]
MLWALMRRFRSSAFAFLVTAALASSAGIAIALAEERGLIKASLVFAVLGAGGALHMLRVFLSPTNYKRMIIAPDGVRVLGMIGGDVAFQWRDVCQLAFLGEYPNDEDIRVQLHSGRLVFFPFEFPDKSRFLRSAASNLGFSPVSPRALRHVANRGVHVLWEGTDPAGTPAGHLPA